MTIMDVESVQNVNENQVHHVDNLQQVILANEENIVIKCENGSIRTHALPFQLFTKLLNSQYDGGFEEEQIILCPNVSKQTVQMTIEFLCTGSVPCQTIEEQISVIQFLKDLTFPGFFDADGNLSNFDNRPKIFKKEVEDETKSAKIEGSEEDGAIVQHSVEKLQEEDINEEKVDDVEPWNNASDLNDEGNSNESQNSARKRKRSSSFRKTSAAKDVKRVTRENDNWKEPLRLTLKTRLDQYPDLMEFQNHTICKICKVLVNWTKRGRINDHVTSQKHLNLLKASKENDGNNSNPVITESERIKLEYEIKKLENIESTESIESQESTIPIQEKLSKRLKDFPWLQKITGIDEVECMVCKCSVGWQRKSHILDHSKSKKHIKAVKELEKDQPELLKKIAMCDSDISAADHFRPTNSYRIVLKQGTPSIQKLWCASILTKSKVATSEVRICYICFKMFLSQSDLTKHSDLEHKDVTNKLLNSPLYNPKSKEFFCAGCNKYMEAKKSLMSFLVHNLICRKMFYTVDQPIQCQSCQLSFTEYQKFKEHLMESHGDLLPERLMCSYCSSTFLTNDELKRHVNQVHTEQYVSCTQCEASFKSKSSLKDHVVKQHIGVKNFSCDQCGKEFYGKNNLRMHMRTHIAPENRPFECNICGLKFIDRKHLSNHEATHTNDRPHQCNLCDARFKIRDCLSSHYIKHHNVSITEIEGKMKNNRTKGRSQDFEAQNQNSSHHVIQGKQDGPTTNASTTSNQPKQSKIQVPNNQQIPRSRADIQNEPQNTLHPPPANHQLPSSMRGVSVPSNSRMKSTTEMSHNNQQQMIAVGVNHGSRHSKQQLIGCGSEQMTAAASGESQQQLQVRRNPQQQATAADRPQQQMSRGSVQQQLRAGEGQPYARNIQQQNSASQRNLQQQPNVFNYFPQQSNF